MFFLLIFSLNCLELKKIPSEYHDLVIRAKAMAKEKAKKKVLSNENIENEILLPGSYSINNYHFELNSAVTGYGVKSLYGYAIDSTKKIAAIISQKSSNMTDINTEKDTVLSLPTLSTLIKIDEKLSEEDDITIVRYYEIEPFSIFSRFQFSNIHSEFPMFSKIYNPLKSYYGNDIYNDFKTNGYCDSDDDSGHLCKGFVSFNWPEIKDGDDISQQEALEKNFSMQDNSGNLKTFSTNIGGVFGLFAGIKIDYISMFDIRITLFIGSEAEAQFKMFMPEGEYKDINFDIGKAALNIFDYPLHIQDTIYTVNVTGVVSLAIKDLAYKINKNLTYHFRGGYKGQKELHLFSSGKEKNTPNQNKIKKFPIKDIPPEKDFIGDKLEFDISIYGGLETVITSSKDNNETFFGVNGGIEYLHHWGMEHKPEICPCPYLIGHNLGKVYVPLETTKPIKIKNYTIIPAKKFSGDTPIWVSQRSDPFCLGSNYKIIDHSTSGPKTSAALILKYVKYGTENKDAPSSKFTISAKYYSKSLGYTPKPIDFVPFQFTKKEMKEGTEKNIDYFVFLDDYRSSSVVTFHCIEQNKNNPFYNHIVHQIGNGMNESIDFISKSGSKIIAKFELEPIISCEFDTETKISIFTKYVSCSPNLHFGDFIGLIYYDQGSNYQVSTTKITDEYSNYNVEDCIYTMKNIWSLKISSLNIGDSDYESIVLSFDMVDGKTTKQIFNTELKKENINDIFNVLIDFEILNPDVTLKMNIEIKKSFFKSNIKEMDIKINQNFFDFKENIIKIESKTKGKWDCELKFATYNYSVIFNVDNFHLDSSIIFAPAFKLNTPFSQNVSNNSPMTDSIDCPLTENDKYGIFKLEFEIDIESYEKLALPINALLIMKKLKPLCESNIIGEDSFIIQMNKKDIYTYQKDNKTIAYYPIPFRREADNPDDINQTDPSIRLVDIYFSPSKNEDECGKIQKFTNVYPFMHSACVLIINEETEPYNYIASTSEKGVDVVQYYYPPNANLDVEWKLFGVSIDFKDKDTRHEVVLWQQEIQFPTNSFYEEINKDITSYLYNDKEEFRMTCPRCSSIRYMKRSQPIDIDEVEPNENNKFVFMIEKSIETKFYAQCKDNNQIQCEATLTGLKSDKLTLLSVPLVSYILESQDLFNFNSNYKIFESFDMQFTYGRDSVSYYTDTKSKVSILHEFENRLNIIIKAQAKGRYIHLFAYADDIFIPFFRQFNANSDTIFDILNIKSSGHNEIGYILIGGSVYLFDDPVFGSISSVDPSFSPILFGIDSNLVESINVNYNEIGEKKNFDENYFCITQTDDSLCRNMNSFPLRYPDFNSFTIFVNYESAEKIHITVEEDLYNFYPVFYNTETKEIVFSCSKTVKISGEFTVLSGMKINFNGPFDLTNLLITSNVDWANEKAGQISFTDDVQISSIDVDIINDPNIYDINYEKEITVIESEKPSLNLLVSSKFVSSFEKFLYTINGNNIKCLYRSSVYAKQNDFCIYSSNRSLCSIHNDMDSINIENLEDFSAYFHGNYGNPIKLHFVEDVTFYEKTLESFFENHPSTTFVFTSEKQINLDGTLKCSKSSTISFVENDELLINNLIIVKPISIMSLYQLKKNNDIKPLINLNDKKISQVKIIAEDYPQGNIIDINNLYYLISNCKGFDGTLEIINNVLQTNYLKYEISYKIDNFNLYLDISSSILYSEPNTFCIYENVICDIELGRPIKSSQLNSMSNFIDTFNEKTLKLIITENVNIDLDVSPLAVEGINSMRITSEKTNLTVSGKIKATETFITTIENLNIDGLTIDIDIDISKATSSFYNVSSCEGRPKIKIIPHEKPASLQEWGEANDANIEVLMIKDASYFNSQHQKMPMNGGFIVPSHFIIGESGNQTIIMKYSFEEIKVEPKTNDHFCLYESDETQCPINVTRMNTKDFCSSNLVSSIKSNNATFLVVNDITLTSECNLDIFETKNNNYTLMFIGDSSIKGHIILGSNTEIAFFNQKLVENLHITINIHMPQDKNELNIKYGKVLLFEGAKLHLLTVNISEYAKEIESLDLESQQFVQGICMDTENIIPTPFTRDFRIKIRCSNTNGIYGMKMKFLTQDYDPNQFCFYENEIRNCIFNNELERFLPVKYSDTEPSFVKEGNDPVIHLFEHSEHPLTLSFQVASYLGHKTAKVINNDNAIVHFYVPIDFYVDTIGTFGESELYLQYDPETNKYGTFKCTGKNIIVHPIIKSHNAFMHGESIRLSSKQVSLSSFLKQEKMEISRINQQSEGIMINLDTSEYNYQNGKGFDTPSIISQLYNPHVLLIATLYMTESMTINPFRVQLLNLGIKSTQAYNLNLDMKQTRAVKPVNNYLYFENVNLTFDNNDNIDFGDIHATFINCKVNNESINKIKGNHLTFDRQSYDSFFSTNDNIYAFNGDDIEATQSYIYLNDEQFESKEIPLIHLNKMNTFNDRYGRQFNFTGEESTLAFKHVLPGTKMLFTNFEDLNIIVDSINDYLSLINIAKCSLKFGDEKNLNIISYLEVANQDSTQMKTNGNVTVKMVNISGDFDGSNSIQLQEIEIPGSTNVKIEKAVLSKSIHINDQSNLTIKLCRSNKPIAITIESQEYSYPQLIFDSNDNISVNSIIAKMIDIDDNNMHYLLRGINQDQCNQYLEKTHIIDQYSHDITTNYQLKCEDDANSAKVLTFKHSQIKNKSLSTGKIAGIVIGCILGVGLIIGIIVLVIMAVKKYCKKERSDNQFESQASLEV